MYKIINYLQATNDPDPESEDSPLDEYLNRWTGEEQKNGRILY